MPSKYIYKNTMPIFEQYEKNNDIDAQARFLAERARQVNQRLYRIEKAGKGINDTAYRYAQFETGKEKPRFSTNIDKIKKMSDADRHQLAENLNLKLVSKTSTLTGLDQVKLNRLGTSVDSLKSMGIDVSSDELLELIDAGGSDFLNKFFLDSSQIVDDWLEMRKKGVTAKEFVREFKRYKKITEDFDYGKLKRNWTRIAERKSKR